jgi:tetratricopeptide (TPR) repeat protein
MRQGKCENYNHCNLALEDKIINILTKEDVFCKECGESLENIKLKKNFSLKRKKVKRHGICRNDNNCNLALEDKIIKIYTKKDVICKECGFQLEIKRIERTKINFKIFNFKILFFLIFISIIYYANKNSILDNKPSIITNTQNKKYLEACTNDDSVACNKLGLIYKKNKNYKDAKLFYTKACDLNYGLGCSNIGWMYEEGKMMKQDYQKAKKLYKKGCDLNNGYSCCNLGGIYYDGNGVDINKSKAKELYKKGWSLRHKKSCNRLKIM